MGQTSLRVLVKLTAKCVIFCVTDYHLTASSLTVIHIIISLHIYPTKMHFANKAFAVGGAVVLFTRHWPLGQKKPGNFQNFCSKKKFITPVNRAINWCYTYGLLQL